jgi:Ca2+-transporting ATPase
LFVNGFILCNDAEFDPGREIRTGDPTELALLDMGVNLGLTKNVLEEMMPRVNELAFDSGRKMMTTVHKLPVADVNAAADADSDADANAGADAGAGSDADAGSDVDADAEVISFTKGAMDRILGRCDFIIENGETRAFTSKDKSDIEAAAGGLASYALRVLALACKFDDDSASEEHLTFVGLVGMIDPPRPEAAGAVERFKSASVTTVMITGDHRDTAFAIAKELGIAERPEQCVSGDVLDKMTQEELNAAVAELRVFARVSPEHKVMIVKAFKSHDFIVSMTGDGVNDAPSLKAADIGVAMGITGTDVAKGAADMILTDDNFATIEKAIREGRNIYNNIRKTVLFLLSSNLGEIIVMFAAIIAGLLSPLKAIHILWVNLITDSLPALALGVDAGDPKIMEQAPRNPKDSLFAHGGLVITVLFGAVIGIITLVAFLFVPVTELLHQGLTISIANIDRILDNEIIYASAQTYAFTTLGISQLFNSVGFQNLNRSIFKVNHLENKMMIAALFIGFALQISVTEIPFMVEAFGTVALSVKEWLMIAGWSTTPLWIHELFVFIAYLRKTGQHDH